MIYEEQPVCLLVSSFALCCAHCHSMIYFFANLILHDPEHTSPFFQVRLMICFRMKSFGKLCGRLADRQRTTIGIPADKGLSSAEVLPYPLCLEEKSRNML